eukprot:1487969-Pleurochrysis_carterae.AAC.1
MKVRTAAGASLLARSMYTALYRVWSSTRNRAYWWPPLCEQRKGPAMSAWMRRPGYDSRQ